MARHTWAAVFLILCFMVFSFIALPLVGDSKAAQIVKGYKLALGPNDKGSLLYPCFDNLHIGPLCLRGDICLELYNEEGLHFAASPPPRAGRRGGMSPDR